MRLSGDILPGMLGFEEARWIAAEDIYVEHLLDVHPNSESTWDARANFMAQLDLHKSHREHAKSHAVRDPYLSAYLMDQQAWVRNEQHRFEEARSEALRALDVFEKLGAASNAELTREILRRIDAERTGQSGR